MKRCYKCQQLKSDSNFNHNKSKHDGLSDECKLCIQKYDKLNYKKNADRIKQQVAVYRSKNIEYYHKYDKQRNIKRQINGTDILHNLKINGCAICGYHKCDSALEFHHVEPKEKSFKLSTILICSGELEKTIEEFYKCMLLCANCHSEIHDKERRILKEEIRMNNLKGGIKDE